MWCLLLLLACDRTPRVRDVEIATVALTEPWQAWALPVGEGDVVYSDAEMLTVHYAGERADALADPWRAAVRQAGWALDLDTSGSGLTSVRYRRDAQVLTLTVIAAADRTTVGLALQEEAP